MKVSQTWVEARKQSALGSTSDHLHLGDTDQNRSPLERHICEAHNSFPKIFETFWITALFDEGVRPFTGAGGGAVS